MNLELTLEAVGSTDFTLVSCESAVDYRLNVFMFEHKNLTWTCADAITQAPFNMPALWISLIRFAFIFVPWHGMKTACIEIWATFMSRTLAVEYKYGSSHTNKCSFYAQL